MARRKQAAVAVPATSEEATEWLTGYVAIEREMLTNRLIAERAIDRIKTGRDADNAVLEAKRRNMFDGLKSWWEAGGAKDAARRKRSVEIAGAKIGTRLAPPAVKFGRGIKEAAIVEWLQGLRWARAKDFLRRGPIKLDKASLIKAAQAEPAIRETFAERGVAVEQTDEFFIDTRLDEQTMREEIAAS